MLSFVPTTSQWFAVSIFYHFLFLDNGKMLSTNFNIGSRYTWSIFRHDFELYIKDIKSCYHLNFWLFELIWCPKIELYFISTSYVCVSTIKMLEQGSTIFKILLLLQRSGQFVKNLPWNAMMPCLCKVRKNQAWLHFSIVHILPLTWSFKIYITVSVLWFSTCSIIDFSNSDNETQQIILMTFWRNHLRN